MSPKALIGYCHRSEHTIPFCVEGGRHVQLERPAGGGSNPGSGARGREGSGLQHPAARRLSPARASALFPRANRPVVDSGRARAAPARAVIRDGPAPPGLREDPMMILANVFSLLLACLVG